MKFFSEENIRAAKEELENLGRNEQAEFLPGYARRMDASWSPPGVTNLVSALTDVVASLAARNKAKAERVDEHREQANRLWKDKKALEENLHKKDLELMDEKRESRELEEEMLRLRSEVNTLKSQLTEEAKRKAIEWWGEFKKKSSEKIAAEDNTRTIKSLSEALRSRTQSLKAMTDYSERVTDENRNLKEQAEEWRKDAAENFSLLAKAQARAKKWKEKAESLDERSFEYLCKGNEYKRKLKAAWSLISVILRNGLLLGSLEDAVDLARHSEDVFECCSNEDCEVCNFMEGKHAN